MSSAEFHTAHEINRVYALDSNFKKQETALRDRLAAVLIGLDAVDESCSNDEEFHPELFMFERQVSASATMEQYLGELNFRAEPDKCLQVITVFETMVNACEQLRKIVPELKT